MVKAFVAGASGYTGGNLVRVLRDEGIETLAHVRPESTQLESTRHLCERVGARLCVCAWDVQKLADTLRQFQPDLIFCAVGLSKLRTARKRRLLGKAFSDTFSSVDVVLVETLVRAAQQAGLNARLVYLSATGTTRFSPGEYYRTRREAEKLISSSGLPFTIVRPGPIGGLDRDDDRLIEVEVVRMGDFLLEMGEKVGLGRLSERFHSHSGHTLARAMLRLALDPGAAGGVFEPEALR